MALTGLRMEGVQDLGEGEASSGNLRDEKKGFSTVRSCLV